MHIKDVLRTVTSPRAALFLVSVGCALSAAGIIFIARNFPQGIYGCDGITLGMLLAVLAASVSHFLVVTYLLPVLFTNVWPWRVRGVNHTTIHLMGPHHAEADTDAAEDVSQGQAARGTGVVNTNDDTAVYVELTNTSAGAKSAVDVENLHDAQARPLLASERVLPAPAPRRKRDCFWWTRATVCSVCVLSAVFIYAFACIGLWLHANTLPDVSSTMTLPGLHMQVKLYREDNEVVHVFGSDLHDTYFAQGYAHAQYRLWQMEFQRRVGAGRLAQVAGKAALGIDKSMRTLGVYPSAVSSLQYLSNDTLNALTAYSAGVNAYIEQTANGDQTLPLEFHLLGYKPEAWRPEDSLVWAKLMSYSLSGNMDREVSRYKLFAQQNLTVERVNELMPPFDSARFPTVLSWEDLQQPYGPGSLYAEQLEHQQSQQQAGWSASAARRAAAGDAASIMPDTVTSLLKAAAAVEREVLAQRGADRHDSNVETSHATESFSFATFSPTMDIHRTFAGLPKIGIRGKMSGASNDWVVSGMRTASSLPLLSNDPHLQFLAPSIWMLMHLSCAPAGMNAIGATFPGLPGIVLGHNDHIAWGVTNTGADVQDMYVMTGNATHYLFDGSMVPYNITEMTIAVKGEADVVIKVRSSYYGTVVTDNNLVKDVNVPMSLRWVSTDPTIPDTTMDAFLLINFATDWQSFRQAMSVYIAPSQNFVFADVAGNIGYQMSGYVPTRNPGLGFTGAWPSPGNGNTTFMWGDRIPFNEMPHTYNPPEGFLATANNRVVPMNYTLFITADWDEGSDGYRAKRITEMIKSSSTHDIQSMQSIQQDYHSLLAGDFVPLVMNITSSSLSDSGQVLQRLLGAWDLKLNVGSPVASLWAQLWRKFASLGAEETGSDYWGDFVFTYRALTSDMSPSGTDPACTRKGFKSCTDFLRSAVNEVASMYPLDDAASHVPLWGSGLHLANFEHQVLNGSPLQCLANRLVVHGGDDSTVNVGHMDLDDDALPQTAGPSFRQIADLSDLQKSLFIHPMGQDGNLLSFGYDALLTQWALGGYLPMLSQGNLVIDASAGDQLLRPA